MKGRARRSRPRKRVGERNRDRIGATVYLTESVAFFRVASSQSETSSNELCRVKREPEKLKHSHELLFWVSVDVISFLRRCHKVVCDRDMRILRRKAGSKSGDPMN